MDRMHLHILLSTVRPRGGGRMLISRADSAARCRRCGDGDSCLAKYHRPVLLRRRKTASVAWVFSGEDPGILACTGTEGI